MTNAMEQNRRAPADYQASSRKKSKPQPVQQLLAGDIWNSARTIAVGLTADQCRTLIPIARDSKVGQDAREAVISIASPMAGDPTSFRLPPPEFAEHTVALRKRAGVRLTETHPRVLMFPAASVLTAIATLVFIGLSIAQLVHPVSIAIALGITVLAGFASRWYVRRQEILMTTKWEAPIWSMIICVLLEGAIHKGQLAGITPTPDEMKSLEAANTLVAEVFGVIG